MKKLQRLELLKDFVQEAVDRGASSVQAVHQYIADLPFEALQQTGLINEEKAGLRQKHQQTIGVVYDAIRRINREIGQLISDQFENLEESTIAAERIAPEPKPASRPDPEPLPSVKPKAEISKAVPARKAAAKKRPATKTAAKKPAAKKSPAKKKSG